jgi:hypothetical protein
MKKLVVIAGAAIVIVAASFMVTYFRSTESAARLHYEREETEVVVSNIAGANYTLFKAGKKLEDAQPVSYIGDKFWLPRGNYFLKVEQAGRVLLYTIKHIS